MLRPCFLVVDREHSSSISTRKLVIETAKFNVITAYSPAEAVLAFQKYPAVDGIVLDGNVAGLRCDELCRELRSIRQDVPIIAIHGVGDETYTEPTHVLGTFDPLPLLKLLRNLAPQATEAIGKQEVRLVHEEMDGPEPDGDAKRGA